MRFLVNFKDQLHTNSLLACSAAFSGSCSGGLSESGDVHAALQRYVDEIAKRSKWNLPFFIISNFENLLPSLYVKGWHMPYKILKKYSELKISSAIGCLFEILLLKILCGNSRVFFRVHFFIASLRLKFEIE